MPGPWNLDNMSLSLNATHPSNNYTEYNVHSLFGHLEGKVTRDFLVNQTKTPIKDKRTFILARSTFSGSGAHVQHWLGDNNRTWTDMTNSIAGIMNFNMFGVPFVGPDTCGFFGAKDDELCGRWIQLATFYPFAREHRDDSGGGPPHEPYDLAEPYQSWAREAIRDRLQYIRHVYTCLFEASQEGQTCFDPLLLHFPTDDAVFEKTEHSFIVGDALKVTPVLTAGQDGVLPTTVKSYFPKGTWVSMKDYSDMVTPDPTKEGEWMDLAAPNSKTDTVNVHLRPGYMVPFQKQTAVSNTKYNTTADVLAHAPLSLVANRDSDGHAQGKLFLDGGETLSELNNKEYEHYEFHLSANSLKKWVLNVDAK